MTAVVSTPRTGQVPAGRDVAVRGLVARAQAGDAEAFGALYERHVGAVHQFVSFKVRQDRHLAEDLTSEVFVRAMRAIGRLTWQEDSAFAGWLMTIARNLITDHFRSRHARRETVTDPVDVAAQQTDGEMGLRRLDGTPATGADSNPEAAVVTHHTNLALLRAVSNLPAEQRECVLLRFWMQLSVQETGRVLGISASAVKSRQTRAMRALARAVPDENPHAVDRDGARAVTS